MVPRALMHDWHIALDTRQVNSVINVFTHVLQPSPHLIASPSGPDCQEKDQGVEEMLSVMTGDMTDEQMKQNLLDALDKRVPTKEVKGKSSVHFVVVLGNINAND